jgi:dsDNA-specific endonuclease/ATPase MutS2
VSQRFDAATTGVADTWTTALAQHQRTGDELLAGLRRAHVDLQAALASRDEQRLAAWTQALASSASSLQQEWQQAGAQTLAQQQQICRTLEQNARDITSQAEAHARSTLAQAASEAPRAAADVVAELRHQLSESMARDNAVLEERSRIMETLRTLLDALNQASAEQRATIDGLVASSSAWLEQAGTRFTEQVDAESRRMAEVAAQVTGSAVEVASLGEAFGFAVQLFSESNDKLTAQLQRIESALSRSIARSDEQLAYYVAQAREVIDLSIMSQRQIVEDLQQFSGSRAPALDPAA